MESRTTGQQVPTLTHFRTAPRHSNTLEQEDLECLGRLFPKTPLYSVYGL